MEEDELPPISGSGLKAEAPLFHKEGASGGLLRHRRVYRRCRCHLSDKAFKAC